MSTLTNVETRPLHSAGKQTQETGNPTTTKQQKGQISMDYQDELTKFQQDGHVVFPASVEDLRSRPNVAEHIDLNGDTEMYERRIVASDGQRDGMAHLWNIEECFCPKTADGPAEVHYNAHIDITGESLDTIRSALTTILRLLPPSEATYLSYLAPEGQ